MMSLLKFQRFSIESTSTGGLRQNLALRSRACAVARLALCALMFYAASSACAAVYPEIRTPMKPVPPGRELDPPPPTDVLYIAIREVEIPPRTRDGRSWDADPEEGAPDPFTKVFLDEEELFTTSTRSNNFKPTWPDAPKKNYDVTEDSILKIELWDENPLHDTPICAKEFKELHVAAVEQGELNAHCDSGARIQLDLKPAVAKFGLGFFYELRSGRVFITKVMPLSPAARQGLAAGQEIVQVMARRVQRLSSSEIQSLINTHAPQGVSLSVLSGGSARDLKLKEGPIYFKEVP